MNLLKYKRESHNINMRKINKLIKKYGEPPGKGATDDLDKKYFDEAMKYLDEQEKYPKD
jgi:hypothetical protein